MAELDTNKVYPVGAKVEIRDAVWRILSVDAVREGGQLLKCEGLSNIVLGRVVYFFTLYEDAVILLTPEETVLAKDTSSRFIQTRLYIESILRTSPKTENDKLYVSYKAAMDPMPYQFDPALQALKQPRPRILIADAVGIGKTLEAGILTSELIARGRAKRILVLATKAVLPQFQQEFWNRFSIPLTALDSNGIQRVRERIPSNQNPFFYFDKAIISVDTLKKDELYREMISQCHWDLIIIDEAHNVAQRSNRSQRAKLAQLLSGKSDAMIMLSATPHDGRAESFASLLNVLDPTAIANPSDYTVDDYADKGLVIRRFKQDVASQVSSEFPERKISKIVVTASPAEEKVFDFLSDLRFGTLDEKGGSEKQEHAEKQLSLSENLEPQEEEDESSNGEIKGARLFRTTLMKAFLSSPQACISLINNRVKNIENSSSADTTQAEDDIKKLEELKELLEKIKPEDFTKFIELCKMLNVRNSTIGWEPKKENDRVVVFTESLITLSFLKDHLREKTGLKADQVITLSGAMKDTEIAERVNSFNQKDSKVRVLLASDVASEGINLHHFAHRMIHFDIPWSLLTFQQRNGRIDRYGQKERPEIYYLLTKGNTSEAEGDMHVLETLIRKDEQAQTNLQDPMEFLPEALQVKVTEEAMESDDFDLDDLIDSIAPTERSGNGDKIDPNRRLSSVMSSDKFEASKAKEISLFESDFDFARNALRVIAEKDGLSQNELRIDETTIDLQPPADLQNRMKYLPPEILPLDNHFNLTADPNAIQRAMIEMRNEGQEWPKKQLLWPNHPIMDWLEGRFLSVFGRNAAPVLYLPSLDKEESWFLLQGGYPNRAGYIPVHRFLAVRFDGKNLSEELLEKELEGKGTEVLTELLHRTRLHDGPPNDEKDPDFQLIESLVPAAIDALKKVLRKAKTDYEDQALPALERSIEELKKLKIKHEEALNLFGEKTKGRVSTKRSNKRDQIELQFNSAEAFQRNNVNLEGDPYMQLIAVFTGAKKEGC